MSNVGLKMSRNTAAQFNSLAKRRVGSVAAVLGRVSTDSAAIKPDAISNCISL